MRRRLRFLVFVIASFLVTAGAAEAASIFVKSSPTDPGDASGDGSAVAPFKTITRALALARKIRFGFPDGTGGSNEMINIHVAAGPYVGSFATPTPAGLETLPLLFNVPRLHLQGALDLDTAGAIVPGTETTVRASTAQAGKQHMVVVTRTNPTTALSAFPPSFEMAGDSVTISGFQFDGLAADNTQPNIVSAAQSALIFLDGVAGFVVRENVLTHAGTFGISTRLSSGRIENNSVRENKGVGLNITGGSEKFPARIVIAGNRVTNNGTGGLGLQAAAQTEGDLSDLFTAQGFRRVPLPQFFDWTHHPEEVPDKLDATVTNNTVSSNSSPFPEGPRGFGIHVNGYLRDNYRLHPLDPERLSAFVRARLEGNTANLNGNYGVVVVAGQIQTSNPRKHVVNIDVSFAGNTLEQNGTGAALFGFSRFATSVLAAEAANLNFKFAHDSTITISADVLRFNFDNSATDPADQTSTNNTLTVNKRPLTGVCIPRVANCVCQLSAGSLSCS